jgi:hypothetical protein
MRSPLVLPSVLGIIALAGVVRFHPILLTSLTTFVGPALLVFNVTPETSFIVPLAISLGWGVVFATLITLFLVPCLQCLYRALEDFHAWKMPEPTPDIPVTMVTDYRATCPTLQTPSYCRGNLKASSTLPGIPPPVG